MDAAAVHSIEWLLNTRLVALFLNTRFIKPIPLLSHTWPFPFDRFFFFTRADAIWRLSGIPTVLIFWGGRGDVDWVCVVIGDSGIGVGAYPGRCPVPVFLVHMDVCKLWRGR